MNLYYSLDDSISRYLYRDLSNDLDWNSSLNFYLFRYLSFNDNLDNFLFLSNLYLFNYLNLWSLYDDLFYHLYLSYDRDLSYYLDDL